MLHIKWAIALILSVAVSVAVTMFFTEKYVNEIGIGQVAEGMIFNQRIYGTLIKTIEDGKADEAKAKLEKWRQIDIRQIKEFRKTLGDGYFTERNSEAIETIDRFLAAHGAQTAASDSAGVKVK